jgi:WD40 repeat protein/energy-coupling factor transporter ATP-binding protein EcfA2
MSFAAVLGRLAKLENPFPGLRPFDTAEAHLFFGRDQQVLDLTDRLKTNHFVAVLGLSGSGKSSLVRAGLIPSLQRGRLLEPGKTWRIAVARPSGAPFANLAQDLECDPRQLRASSHGLIEWARHNLNAQQEALLVVIDQFEELFRYKDSSSRADTDASASSEAAAFIGLLLASARSPLPIYIVITMRTDYLGDCAEFPDFPEALNESQYLVPRLTREQRRQAIEGPLGRVRISSSLVERILNDAGDEPDQLPILQHAIMRTWSHWHAASPENTRPIENQDYDAVGGFTGALDQHANELLKTQPVAAAPTYVETIFKRLTALGRGNRERRDPAVLSELWELCGANSDDTKQRVKAIIDVFRKGEATFLAPREGDLKAETYIDIAHESLIRNWKILKQRWLPDEEKQAKTLIELAERASGWRAHERDLLAGLDLAGATQWNRRRNPSPKWAEHYAGAGKLDDVQSFLGASNRRYKQSQLKTRLLAVFLFALLLAGLILSFLALRTQKTAQSLDLAGRAESLVSLGRSSEAIATAKQAFDIDKTPQARDALAHAFPQEIVDCRGHTAPVSRAVFSPDEQLILTASGDHTAQLWNAHTGALVVKLTGHTTEVRSARFSPNGQLVLTAGDLTARLWDTATGKPIATLAAHTSDVNSAVFSPNGKLIVTASSDWTARVWDAASHNPIATLTGHAGPVTSARFSPDSSRVVTASNDDTARIWNATNGQLIAKLQGHAGDVKMAVFSPDGKRVLTASADHTARIWNASNGQLIAALEGHSANVNSALFSADGKLIVTASDDRTAMVWNAATAKLVVKLEGHAGFVTSASFSPDSQLVVTSSRDGTVHVWKADSGLMLADLTGHNGFVNSAIFSADGLHILSAGEDDTARVWNIAASAEVLNALTGPSDGITSAAFSPDGQHIVTASMDHTAWVWNRRNGRFLAKLFGHNGSVNTAAFSPDGRSIVTASSDHTVRVWASDTSSSVRSIVTSSAGLTNRSWDGGAVKTVLQLNHPDEVNSAVFSPDGKQILTGCNDKIARLWEVDTGKVIRQFSGHRGIVLNATFSPDGKKLATASEDKSAWIWDAATGNVIQKLIGHAGAVWTVGFSADGQRLVTASDDGTARVWDAGTGKQLLLLEGHGGAVYSAAFSPNGKSIVTASYDKTVRVWDAADGHVIAKLEGHSDSVSTAAFSNDNNFIVTASLDRTSLIVKLVTLSDMETLLSSK